MRALLQWMIVGSISLLLDSSLDYENSYALARKCTWALADIGTADAKLALQNLSNVADQEISLYARKRLQQWSLEINRKRA